VDDADPSPGNLGAVISPSSFVELLRGLPYVGLGDATTKPGALRQVHARKFVAALQAASAGGPVLLRIERHSGHGGADMLEAEVEKGADRYAFALAHTAGP
jgi:hypothetical protein